MVLSTFNHIQESNGSHWNRLMRGENAQKICIVAIDAAKFVNAAMICNVYGDILVKPFEFNASFPGFNRTLYPHAQYFSPRAVITARARVRRSNQIDVRRKLVRSFDPVDDRESRFERLPQRIDDEPWKMAQFIQK